MQEVNEVVDVTTQTMPQNNWTGLLVYCVLVFGIIYLFMVRPNKKRMTEYQKMLDGLKVGDKILAAGIYGIIKKINEKSVDMEVSKGVVIEVAKAAIANVEK